MGKRVLYVATVVKTHIMHFHIPYLKMFKELGWHTAVAARNDYEDPSECRIPYCDEYYDIAFERSPLKWANVKAYRELKKIIADGKYDIVHCHTPVAAILTRLAARRARKQGTRVFYTAHGFHFFKGAPLINWLVYFPVEWVCSLMTDTLITITQEDYSLARRWMKAKKIEYIPGVGVDFKKHQKNELARLKICQEYAIDESATILLSVGELIERKNHKTVIQALGTLASERNIYYLIAGNGVEKEALAALIKEKKVAERVHLLGYRTDVSDLYSAADFFVLPSYQEGLSVSLMEAMAHRLPCIVSRIRGNVELIDKNGGRLFDPCKIDDFKRELLDILNCDAGRMGQYNYEKVKRYSLDNIIEKMKRIYGVNSS